MVRADFAAQKIEGFNVVNESVEVKVLEVGARQREAFRHIGPAGAPDRLLSGDKFPIEAAHVIREKSAAVAGTDLQVRKPVEDAAVDQQAEGKRRVGGVAA